MGLAWDVKTMKDWCWKLDNSLGKIKVFFCSVTSLTMAEKGTLEHSIFL
jgi:hypothetical protein